MEKWLPSPIREDLYLISNYGNVRNKRTGRILNIRLCKGYFTLNIRINGEQKNIKVHRLVAQLFVQNLDNKPCVNHKDGNKLNNHFSNLEWCTIIENNDHARKNNLIKNIPKGEKAHCAKFKDDTILEIRKLRKEGKTNKELAILFNTYPSKISHICRNKIYKHLNSEKAEKEIKLGGRKLLDKDIFEIRNLLIKNSVISIAKKYNVSETTIRNIKNNVTWKHLKGEENNE